MSTEKEHLVSGNQLGPNYGGSETRSIETMPDSYTVNSDLTNKIKRRKYRLDNFFPCDPRRWFHRFLMLGFMCFLSFGELY